MLALAAAAAAAAAATLQTELFAALDETRRAVEAERTLQDRSTDFLRRRLRRKKLGGRGRGRGRQAAAAAAAAAAAEPPQPQQRVSRLLVLGIITNPRTPQTREWIRASYLSAHRDEARVLLRFVLGRRGLSKADRKALATEQAKSGDLERIDASDFDERGGIFSCIDKLFAWFPHAVAAYPGAAFYAKADDDSYVELSALSAMLSPLTSTRNAYLGYLQYDSFLPAAWKHCGWAAGPVGAAHAHTHGCPKGEKAVGPFPFAVGALTVMGADLASWMRGSAHIRDLVAAGRASQASQRHWDCGYSDVTLGYALATSNLSLSLVSVRDAMRDATYGAMSAEKFVVAHHLRTRKQFDAAHAAAKAAAGWSPKLEPCTPWPRVAQTGANMLSLGEDSRASLERGMAAFGCCQRWSVCEVRPAS